MCSIAKPDIDNEMIVLKNQISRIYSKARLITCYLKERVVCRRQIIELRGLFGRPFVATRYQKTVYSVLPIVTQVMNAIVHKNRGFIFSIEHECVPTNPIPRRRPPSIINLLLRE